MSNQRFYFGRRGERPAFIPAQVSWERQRTITNVPGVVACPGGFRCTWDVAWAVAALLDQPPPTPPLSTDEEYNQALANLPGIDEYRQLELNKRLREYQITGAGFLALRSWAMLCDPMRAGKTLTALTASVLVGTEKTLVVCPALPKLGWAEEIAKWVDEEAVILEGRAGTVARRFCKVCMGRGKIDGKHCEACKLKNGQSNGLKLFKGKEEVAEAIRNARYVIVNYDLLVAQKAKDGTGRTYYRTDLPGWVPMLSRYYFDTCLLDESHNCRGWSSDESRRGQTRRERVCAVCAPIDRVWAITGTPMFGFVRDYWGQLDVISNGACSGREDRLPFSFHVRYADGQKGEFGWIANGRTPFAETELPRRLSQFVVRRDRKDILPFMPPKHRQVIRIEGDAKLPQVRKALRGKASAADKTKKLMLLTAQVKAPYVIENVMEEILEGQKCMIVCYSPDTVRIYEKEIAKAIKKKDVRTRIAAVNLKTWGAHGGVSTDARFKMGRNFREHEGAGIFLMTIDAFQVGVSLLGASTEHWVDLHHDPAAVLQAEDRAYEPGVTGLSLVYYVMKGSIDEHREALILPKVEALARVQSDADAESLQLALGGETTAATLESMLDDLTASIDEDFWEDF